MTQEERNFSRVIRDEATIQALTKGQLELTAINKSLVNEIKDLETANQSWKDEQAKNVETIYELREMLSQTKRELSTALDRLEKSQEDFDRVDDAAEYWKENFEQLFNSIVRSVTTDGEELTDGEVVDQIFDTLKKYQGESDEQIKINL